MSELERKANKSNGAFIVIILLLCGGLGFMAYLWSSKNKELEQAMDNNKQLKEDMEGMNNMLSGYVDNMSMDFKADLQNMLDTYDALEEKDQSKAAELEKEKAKIKELQAKVEQGKMTAYQLYLAQEEIKTMRKIMRGYIEEIDALNTLNLQLTNDLDSTNTVLGQTQADRDRLQEENENQSAQLSEAAKLNAYTFDSGALKSKIGGSMGPTTRARNAAQFKSSFTIGSNKVAPAGNKTVYMQITGPDGKVMQKRSSYILETNSGKKVAYTDRKEINYNRQSIDVTVYYDLNGANVSKGNYKVRIYCQGDLIGSDSFTLK